MHAVMHATQKGVRTRLAVLSHGQHPDRLEAQARRAAPPLQLRTQHHLAQPQQQRKAVHLGHQVRANNLAKDVALGALGSREGREIDFDSHVGVGVGGRSGGFCGGRVLERAAREVLRESEC